MTAPDTFVWITVDESRGLALVTGRGVKRILQTEFLLTDRMAKWSPYARGWVIPAVKVPDLVAACEYWSVPVKVRQVTP
ncbi:MAG: hypothetical protein GEV10_13790 [Streptosporangiales bacterium]|nr:hypothetical protein [Streptosporangiales bacterium]